MAGRVHVTPIADVDVPAAATFLHAHLNGRVPAGTWERALRQSWGMPPPNHGFILRRDIEVLGVLLAFYSRREVDGSPVDVCNLGAWCVLPEARMRSLSMLRAALAQEGYVFTDFSPSGAVIPLNKRLGFTELDTRAVLLPALPLLPARGVAVIDDPDRVADYLSPSDRRIFEDHRAAAAARHVVLVGADGPCYVVHRRDRRKGLPVFATVLYVSDRERFAPLARRLATHLLREGVLALLVDERIGGRPRGARTVTMNRPKMVRSTDIAPEQFDYLYSELTCVPW